MRGSGLIIPIIL